MLVSPPEGCIYGSLNPTYVSHSSSHHPAPKLFLLYNGRMFDGKFDTSQKKWFHHKWYPPFDISMGEMVKAEARPSGLPRAALQSHYTFGVTISVTPTTPGFLTALCIFRAPCFCPHLPLPGLPCSSFIP